MKTCVMSYTLGDLKKWWDSWGARTWSSSLKTHCWRNSAQITIYLECDIMYIPLINHSKFQFFLFGVMPLNRRVQSIICCIFSWRCSSNALASSLFLVNVYMGVTKIPAYWPHVQGTGFETEFIQVYLTSSSMEGTLTAVDGPIYCGWFHNKFIDPLILVKSVFTS